MVLAIAPVNVVYSQGFAGLGTTAEGYDVPNPETKITFPKDHGSHPGFRIEWWYLTANLKGTDGKDYGAQWTLFRSALQPPDKEQKKEKPNNWFGSQLWMAHAAVTARHNHWVAESRARGNIGLAGVSASPFKAWINDWSMTGDKSSGISNLRVQASGTDFSYDLNLQANGPIIFHGANGYSVKSSLGQASHYYSQPFYRVDGMLNLPHGEVAVTGSAWLDREWSSQPLGEKQKGWDWASLNFDDGSKLMGFRLRQDDGKNFTSGTWSDADGKTTPFSNGKIKFIEEARSTINGKEIPTKWRLLLPEKQVDIEFEAINSNSWMATSVPYWEGPVTIKGSHTGRGYLEMTGYDFR